MKVNIREFKADDIPLKVKWINDHDNNQYLHYDLPLEEEKTLNWFKHKDNRKRFDAIITVDGKSVGLIGLININFDNESAEYYITLGEKEYKHKGIASKASDLLLHYGFHYLKLKTIYLTTEVNNISMQKLAEQMGMSCRGRLPQYVFRNGNLQDVYYYSIISVNSKQLSSPIEYLFKDTNGNKIYIKREDKINFSFGGNKVRKSFLFEKEIILNNHDCIVTYGSRFSNHCRVIADLAKKLNINCVIISPMHQESTENLNRTLIRKHHARIIDCELDQVSATISDTIQQLKEQGYHPYFIPGGGHNLLGTHAYIQAYSEIYEWSKNNDQYFDYIFLASGTGTTQAGLAIGNEIIGSNQSTVIGISIARKNPRGKSVIIQAANEYLCEYYPNICHIFDEETIHFNDEVIITDYGVSNEQIDRKIEELYLQYGIPMSKTYTGKAYVGMENYVKKNNLKGKKILFIHTGGVPLFFDEF